MGTDIHLGVERLHNGKWEPLEDVLPSHEELMKAYDNCGSEDPEIRRAATELLNRMPWHRNYDLFAMLADVRNGVGFGGYERCERVTPLFAGRGRPEDSCFPELEQMWLGGYHSYTWCTYAEAMKAPWTRPVVTKGVIPYEHWLRWRLSDNPHPDSWSQGVFGGGVRTVDEAEAALMKENRDEIEGVYVRSQWEWQPLADSPFRRWLLSPEFQAAAAKYGPENIRICMSFDS